LKFSLKRLPIGDGNKTSRRYPTSFILADGRRGVKFFLRRRVDFWRNFSPREKKRRRSGETTALERF
jgi:hypothetical protein